MTTTTPEEDADAIISRLVDALVAAGLLTEILEASVRVRVQAGPQGGKLAEVINLKPDADDVLCFWWSWDEPICRASDIARAVAAITYVVTP